MGAAGSELKRVRQSLRNNLRNRHYKSMVKSSIKKVMEADKKDAPDLLVQAISIIDRVCGKGIIHKNRASHQKSKLTKYINSL
jgi:small subunit ribosomal protein S20|tara:strand:+ start:61 stop:309 length:249 start_codon:yes stop_codon:yes gene_type:complete